MTSFDLHQDSLKSTKRLTFDSHFLPDLQKRPRLSWQPGADRGLEGSDFQIVNRNRVLPDADDLRDTRRYKNRKPVQWIEPAKQVAGKEGQLELLYAIVPPPPSLIRRHEEFLSLPTHYG